MLTKELLLATVKRSAVKAAATAPVHEFPTSVYSVGEGKYRAFGSRAATVNPGRGRSGARKIPVERSTLLRVLTSFLCPASCTRSSRLRACRPRSRSHSKPINCCQFANPQFQLAPQQPNHEPSTLGVRPARVLAWNAGRVRPKFSGSHPRRDPTCRAALSPRGHPRVTGRAERHLQ